MFSFEDQLGRNIILKSFPPKRIVSLVPSQTELLFHLGLDEEAMGITKFCVHPEHWFKTKERVGGTKNVNIEKVRSLQPDLILANKEENVKDQIDQLEKIAPVWISDIKKFDEALQMIRSIGGITDCKAKAEMLLTRINENFSELRTYNHQHRTVYLIWRDPYMTVGGDTFINDMLCKCGLQNVFENEKRYPEISIEQLVAVNPHLILLSSEPYLFRQKHIDELQPFFSDTKILLADGEMFSWYGSRMIYAPEYFTALLERIDSN